MGFELFEGQRVRVTDVPTVTIQKRGIISLNLPAHEAIGSPESVELLYDRERRLVAVRGAADPASPSAYKLRSLSRGDRPPSSYLLSGKAFTGYYGIETDTGYRRTAQIEGNMLVIDLNDPGIQVVGNRNRQSNGHGKQRERSLLDG